MTRTFLLALIPLALISVALISLAPAPARADERLDSEGHGKLCQFLDRIFAADRRHGDVLAPHTWKRDVSAR